MRIAQGDLDAAEAYYRQLDAAAARYGSLSWLALAHQARGELAAARGEVDRALAHYADFQAAGNQYKAAQCLEAITLLQQQQPAPETVQAG